jgi:uncharacterized protein (DUF983 family)
MRLMVRVVVLAHKLYTVYSSAVLELSSFSFEGGYAMRCPRCQGRMFAEKFYDFVRSFDAWKCSCCGELVDSTILQNRARSSSTFLG